MRFQFNDFPKEGIYQIVNTNATSLSDSTVSIWFTNGYTSAYITAGAEVYVHETNSSVVDITICQMTAETNLGPFAISARFLYSK